MTSYRSHDSHPVGSSQLVFGDDERHERPKCAGQEGISHAHQRHGEIGEPGGGTKKSQHGVCSEGKEDPQIQPEQVQSSSVH